jgi:uncharacterized protein YbjT (DUF2867 family)
MSDGTILVIGGTGDTGKLVVQRLVARGRPVRVYARNEDKARGLFGTAVEIVRGEVDDEAKLAQAMAGVSEVVISLNAKAVTWKAGPGPKQINFEALQHMIAAAKRARFEGRFIYVSSLYVLRRNRHPLGIFLNLILKRALTWNYRAERLLARSGIRYSIVRPGGLRDEPGREYRIVVDRGDRIMGLISREDAADVITHVVLDPRTEGLDIDCARDQTSKGTTFKNDYAAQIAALSG